MNLFPNFTRHRLITHTNDGDNDDEDNDDNENNR